jgi:hypothetical protein
MSTPHAVYRYFDSAGRLLYVGMTKRPGTRRTEHKMRSPWFGQMVRESIEWFPDIQTAGVEEQRAIETERPSHNRMLPPWNVVAHGHSWVPSGAAECRSPASGGGGSIRGMRRGGPGRPPRASRPDPGTARRGPDTGRHRPRDRLHPGNHPQDRTRQCGGVMWCVGSSPRPWQHESRTERKPDEHRAAAVERRSQGRVHDRA